MTRRARAHRRLLAGAVLCGVLAPALLTSCAESVDPIERLGRKAAEKMPRKEKPGTPGCRQAPEAGQSRAAATPTGELGAPETRCPGKASPVPARPRSAASP